MTVADTITSIQTHVQEAYDAIANKGGAVPVDKNLENLDDAIKTLEDAGVTPGPYGALYYLATINSKTVLRGVQLNTEADFNAMCTNTNYNSTITVNGATIIKSAVVRYAYGTEPITEIPDYFCAYFSSMIQMTTMPNSVTKIGNYFMYYCQAHNQQIVFPDNLIEIGSNFLVYNNKRSSLPDLSNTKITAIPNNFCNFSRSVNSTMIIPEGVTSIGANFLYGCSNFNSKITLPGTLKTIDNYFLGFSTSYNQPIEITSPITSIGNYFLYKCSSFAASITINGNDGTIGNSFAEGISTISSTSAPKSIDLTGSWTNIGSNFLVNSAVLNCPITIAGNKLAVGNSFLAYQTNFNSQVTFTGTMTSIGNGFMRQCTPLSAAPVFADGLETIGSYFMYEDAGIVPSSLKFPTVTTVGDYFLYKAGISSFNGTALVYMSALKKAGNNFCYACRSGQYVPNCPNLEEVGNFFCAHCSFTQFADDVMYPKLKTIGSSFMAYCTGLQTPAPLQLPTTLTTPIPTNFLYDCPAITKIAIPANVTFAKSDTTLSTINKMDLISYTQGITLSGEGAAAAKTALPNLTSGTWRRKLL
ncbi:MAG: leucine-rich repeat domain-containing protein [Lachnospiraceae bacterium]|nr:leucine-rich repeat domain-containing protein [Lachnospiraceae bacterium]